ncbi:MAG: hypothetical protein K9J38_08000 [Polynucleobacter sp.]|jgi:hypothetical protein|nr:hypothetical protein [Polynucleobacter sp.]
MTAQTNLTSKSRILPAIIQFCGHWLRVFLGLALILSLAAIFLESNYRAKLGESTALNLNQGRSAVEKNEPRAQVKVDSEPKVSPEARAAEAQKVLQAMGAIQVALAGKKPLDRRFFQALEKPSADLAFLAGQSSSLPASKEIGVIKNQSDVLLVGARVQNTLKMLLDQEKEIATIAALAPSANSFTNPKSFLDLQSISKESPLRKMAEAMEEYARSHDLVQKNAIDLEVQERLLKALNLGVEQIAAIEKRADTLNAQQKDTLNKLLQTPWPTKGQSIKEAVVLYMETLTALKNLTSDLEPIKVAVDVVDPKREQKGEQKVLSNVAGVDKKPSGASDSTQVDANKLVAVLVEIQVGMGGQNKPYTPQFFQGAQKWVADLESVLSVKVDSEDGKRKDLIVPKTQAEVILIARRTQQSLQSIISQEKALAGVIALGSTSTIMTSPNAPNAILSMQKISVESPLRGLAGSFDEFVKANSAWQKSFLEGPTNQNLLKELDQTLEQITALENTVSNQPPFVVDVLGKIRQVAWQAKAPEVKVALSTLLENSEYIRKQLADTQRLTQAANNVASPGIASGITEKISGIGSQLPLIAQLGALFFLCAGLLGSFAQAKVSAEQLVVPDEEDRPLDRVAPYIVPPAAQDNSLVNDLQAQIKVLEQKFVEAFHSSEKVLSYSQEVMNKVSVLRNVQSASDVGPRYLHLDVEQPLDEIDSAIVSLKQLGIRLFLSILENHSAKQLASETEHMNHLVIQTELAFVQIKNLVKDINQKALPTRATSDQANIDLIELDMNQVMVEAKRWQAELKNLNESLMALNRLVGQYV